MEQTRRPRMDRDSGEIVLSQDKAVPQLSRNSPNSRHEVCGNALRRCGRSAERTGGTSFVVNMQRMRDKGSETRMRACGILSADGPRARNLDKASIGDSAGGRRRQGHARSPRRLRRPLTPPPAPRSSASMAGKVNFPALQVDADSVRRPGFTRVVVSRHTHRASGKRRCAHRGSSWRTR